jgi:4-hydroxy-2-oxoheptanedioate aldolase
MRTNPIKEMLRKGETSVGTWLSLCSPIAAKFMAHTGMDWLTVDMEHSPYDWEKAASLYFTIADAGCTPLVRVPAGRHDHIKRALDSGAHGVIVPMVMDRAEAEYCVAAMKYPPKGNRSVGGMLHALNFAAAPDDYYAKADDELLLVVLQCEHIEAVRRADEIFSVPGIDAIFVGPNDLRASMRSADGKDPTPEAFEAALQQILAACKRNGVAAGIHCFSSAEILMRSKQGWQFLALGSDLSLMLSGTRAELEALDRRPSGELAKY